MEGSYGHMLSGSCASRLPGGARSWRSSKIRVRLWIESEEVANVGGKRSTQTPLLYCYCNYASQDMKQTIWFVDTCGLSQRRRCLHRPRFAWSPEASAKRSETEPQEIWLTLLFGQFALHSSTLQNLEENARHANEKHRFRMVAIREPCC